MARRKQAAGPREEPQIQKADMDFAALVSAIREAHEQCAAQANRAVNVVLTMRNWLVGRYLREYEQRGSDRAQYGERLLNRVAEELRRHDIADMSPRSLRLYRRLYLVYPGIWQSPIAKSGSGFLPAQIWQSLIAKSDESLVVPGPPANQSDASRRVEADGQALAARLSFTHLTELVVIDDPLKRAFYEIECIRGNWSVRQLKRQIASLYFERSGLSRDKDKLAAMVQAGAERTDAKLDIRDPCIFEFLGLRARDAVAESDLEAALVENLREFLLELGHGFCLEAQQKSIVIGRTRGFVDLVFYHRVLKCHVLVDLKVDEFRHEHIGQLNTYVTWYRKHMMTDGDNPPIGLLLCTGKDHAFVEYALAAMDNRLFVSMYQLELPSKEDLRQFIEEKRQALGDPS